MPRLSLAPLVAVSALLAGCSAVLDPLGLLEDDDSSSRAAGDDAGEDAGTDAGGRADAKTPADAASPADAETCAPKTCADLGAVCGAASDGCGGELECGACGDPAGERCSAGKCVPCDDAYEPNDAPEAPTDLGSLTDDPDSSKGFADGSLHDEADVDFFVFKVRDTGFGGNPKVTITATPQIFGQEIEVAMWPRCDSVSPGHTVAVGEADATYGKGCVSTGAASTTSCAMTMECSGTDNDHTTVLARVRPKKLSPVCAGYSLQIRVL